MARLGTSQIGTPSARIRMRTVEKPWDCKCTWSVVRPGPGRLCISELTYLNAACLVRHEREKAWDGND